MLWRGRLLGLQCVSIAGWVPVVSSSLICAVNLFNGSVVQVWPRPFPALRTEASFLVIFCCWELFCDSSSTHISSIVQSHLWVSLLLLLHCRHNMGLLRTSLLFFWPLRLCCMSSAYSNQCFFLAGCRALFMYILLYLVSIQDLTLKPPSASRLATSRPCCTGIAINMFFYGLTIVQGVEKNRKK